MAFYRKIDTRIQNDEKYLSLSRDGRQAWFDVFASERLNNFGAMRTSIQGLAYDMALLKWEPKDFIKALQENITKGLIANDGMILWFPKYLNYNSPANSNVMRSWPKLIDALPACPLRNKIIETLMVFVEKSGFPKEAKREVIEGLTKGLSEGLSKEPLIVIVDSYSDPISIPNDVSKKCSLNGCFELFWNLAEPKEKKADCAKIWDRIPHKDHPHIIERYRLYPWGTFRVHPKTWLNAKQWDDDYESIRKNQQRESGSTPNDGRPLNIHGKPISDWAWEAQKKRDAVESDRKASDIANSQRLALARAMDKK